jgi:hypothetical protein
MIPGWLSWFIAILRASLGIEADIRQRQEEHVGKVIQQNTDLKAEAAHDDVALKADADAPTTKSDKLTALEQGQE